ncbi:MAG: class I SAM-dependent methyltransferase [Deltaproteobacteria bacterium]|jgi:daunosaminyl-N,N-dimethyltransferase/N-dimethyltransferase|nr:class I SAM-dependent methyltransferase [Deltaproteobacteria bacterium]MBW2534827.1 class I SAM-dependent methyltransferase [Deltaproteobacteria bacterium]
MDSNSLYRTRAELYDRIYHYKDYAVEGERIHELLAARGVVEGALVVEAACGTGSFLQHLRHHYRVAGFDLHEPMLKLARHKLCAGGRFCDVRLWQADMTDFELDPPADALLCLFSSIAYVFPIEQLAKTARCFYRAVRPGGVVIVEPFVTPSKYRHGHASMQTYDGEDLKLVRCCVGKAEGRRTILDFHWLVATPQLGVDHFVERHELWLYEQDELLETFATAGFEAEFTADGLLPDRGLLLARRPLSH